MQKNNELTHIIYNKKVSHEYFILETYEAGIVLTGTEIKSLRKGKINIKDSYAKITKEAEIVLFNAHIEEYEQGNRYNHDPKRTRKLLLHKKEINKLIGKIQLQGLTLIPIKIYFKGSYAKIELGLCKGKNQHDKRKSEAKRSAQKEIQQALKNKNKGEY